MELTYISVNWPELAKIIKARKPLSVYGFVTGLEETTGGYIYRKGHIVRYENRPNPWLYATYNCGREIKIRMTFENGTTEEIACETLHTNWKLGEYWPKEAAALVENIK